MDEIKAEFKRRKDAFKKAKRRAVTLWKALAITLLVLTLIVSLAGGVIRIFDHTVAAVLGDRFWKVIQEDGKAVRYEMDFASDEEMYEHGDRIQYQVESEGAVLLMNNGALPLAEGTKVSLLYSCCDGLGTALEQSGLLVVPAAETIHTQEEENALAVYGDAAIITLSGLESGASGLSRQEESALEGAARLKADGKVKSIIVLLNTSKVPQVGFLKGNTYSVDACLWIGDVDGHRVNAVADILAGKVNPSGSLVETYCFDNATAPAAKNAVPVSYENGGGEKNADYDGTHLVYQEGIYVGYRYYETRYEDFVMGTGNAGEYTYGDLVVFPFGYGLSYTTFDYSDMAVVFDGEKDRFEVAVTVTNTGNTAGKKTVQVYAQSPYTEYDKTNKVEKAAVQLIGWGKTSVLEPGNSERVTVHVERRDLASFDAYGVGTYILDAGDYYFAVADNSHDAVNTVLAAKGYTVENTAGRMDADGNAGLVCKWEQEKFDRKIYATTSNGAEIVSQSSLTDPNLYAGTVGQNVTWLSRNNWEGTYPADEQITLKLTETLSKELQHAGFDSVEGGTEEMPTLGAKNGLKLYDMIGLAYDDPRWETLLDQLTYEEMAAMIDNGYYWRMPVESVHAPGSRVGFAVTLFDCSQDSELITVPADIMAATFNTELAYEAGKVIGNSCLAAEVSCIYNANAKVSRLSRSSNDFLGCSEDGLLAGAICAAQNRGVQDKGVDVRMRDFGMNGAGFDLWVNEQATQEIYLKACRITFNNDGTHSMCNSARSSVVDRLAGYEDDPGMVSAMRQICHRELYARANSSAMNGIGPETTIEVHEPSVTGIVRITVAVLWLLTATMVGLWISHSRKFKRTEEFLSYRTIKQILREDKKAK